MKEEQDWVFVVMAGVSVAEPRPHLHCTRCGERLVTVLPLKVDTYLEVSRGFMRAHRNCKGTAAA
jgi:hypothetical protein